MNRIPPASRAMRAATVAVFGGNGVIVAVGSGVKLAVGGAVGGKLSIGLGCVSAQADVVINITKMIKMNISLIPGMDPTPDPKFIVIKLCFTPNSLTRGLY